ncbi:hypothetical protein SAICODRAFT_91538 [Saitoella complicata NRRL Y-17804]|nr:uncharacterized protein SAICODRAFT_91538 [Saitoella complicata NRRL Y-17804]ODQ53676.1 hypothetical protein SAICODRAFT_91538 [Saitoella complicata NRRL Y-17804]
MMTSDDASSEVPSPPQREESSVVESIGDSESPQSPPESTFTHTLPIHTHVTSSILTKETNEPVSLGGLKNLGMLVLLANNLRLILENHTKYGFLLGNPFATVPIGDVKNTVLVWCLIPLHILFAVTIEKYIAKKAIGTKKKHVDNPTAHFRDHLYCLAHVINAGWLLAYVTYLVYFHIYHPLLGSACEVHALIVSMKLMSYYFTNRDLRKAFVKDDPVPKDYVLQYPQNISVRNIMYFWWAPTLVYQPSYPRSNVPFRKLFFLKRCGEISALFFALWFVSAQYANPILINSLSAMHDLRVSVIVERILKLSTVSIVIWLAAFFCIFQSILNALAEVIGFGDRSFYMDWWNAGSLGTYWRLWNRPVYNYMKRHVYLPLRTRGFSATQASTIVFLISAFLHELLVGIPTHNLSFIAFSGMMFQVPLIMLTAPLEKMRGPGTVIGNCIFWVSFVIVGQPTAVLWYYYRWHAMHGTVGQSH